MIVVVDACIFLQALFGSRGTLTIITSQNHQFYVPAKIVKEVEKQKNEACHKLQITSEEFMTNLEALLKFVHVLQYIEYEPWMQKSKEALQQRDVNDADYLACALSVNANFLWTQDKDFGVQQLVPTKTTAQFIEERKH